MIARATIGLHKEAILTAKGGPSRKSKKFWAHKDSKSFKVWQQQRAVWEKLYAPAPADDSWDDACHCPQCDLEVLDQRVQMFVDDSPELDGVVVNGKTYTRFGG